MKQNSAFAKVILCFLLSALVLTSCGEGESSTGNSSIELSEAVSDSGNSENSSIEESKAEVSEALKSEENSEELKSLGKINRKILYNAEKLPMAENMNLKYGFYILNDSEHIMDYFENSENDDAYYAVCFLNGTATKKRVKEYLESFGIEYEEVYVKFFAVATEEQINALINAVPFAPYVTVADIG